MKHIFILILLLISIYDGDTASAQQLEHNITADSIILPPKGAHVPMTKCPFDVKFTNNGVNIETNVVVIAEVTSRLGPNIDTTFRDTVDVPTFQSGETKVISFKKFNNLSSGQKTFRSLVRLGSDMNISDDTVASNFTSSYEKDVQGQSVLFPSLNQELPEKGILNPIGEFRWQGVFTDSAKNFPVRVQIRNCVDRILVFQADTIIPMLNFYQPVVQIVFPGSQGGYDTKMLDKGCYKIGVISRFSTDGDRTNDTAYSYFTLLEHKLSHDLSIDSIYSPLNYTHYDTNSIPVKIRVRNAGLSNEQKITLIAKVKTSKDSVIYQDTAYIPALSRDSLLDVSFSNLVVSRKGPYSVGYKLEIISTMDNDDFRWNDTVRSGFGIGYSSKVVISKVITPKNGDVINAGSLIRPTVILRALWGTDFSQYKLRAEIRYIPTNEILYSCDSLMPQISTDDSALEYIFPVPKGVQSTGIDSILRIHSGSYECKCYITSKGTNYTKYDSASVNFEVVGNSLYYDIAIDSILHPGKDVVVGKHPQYIKILFRNNGTRSVGSIDADITITDSNSYSILQERKTIPTILSQDTELVTFGPFTPTVGGLHKIWVRSWPVMYPQWYYDDTLTQYFTVDSTLTSVLIETHLQQLLLSNSNHPNPFSATTTLSYEVASSGYITMRILDVSGVTRETVMSDVFVSEGKHEVTLDGSHLPSGTYFVEMVVTNFEGILARKIQPITIRR